MSERYLIVHVAQYSIAIPADVVNRIEEHKAFKSAKDVPVLDLRHLLETEERSGSVAVSIDTPALVFIVDRVERIVSIAEPDFLPLPAPFEFACTLFDAVSRQPIAGGHLLRLKAHVDAPPKPL